MLIAENIKSIWKKEPQCIISDESQAIIGGDFSLLS